MRAFQIWLFTVLGLALGAGWVEAGSCGTTLGYGPTLDQECRSADVVLLVTVLDSDIGAGTTTFRIDRIVKGHPVLGDAKELTIGRCLPSPKPNSPTRMLVLGDVADGKLELYMGKTARSAALADYVQSVLSLSPDDQKTRLPFFFRHLEHDEPEVAQDAFVQVAKADEKDLLAVAPKLDPEKLRGWLADTTTSASRLNLYGLLLGYCGRANDVELLLKSRERAGGGKWGGLLTGCVLLNPKEGLKQVRSLLADGEGEFIVRYEALRSARYLFEHHPEVIPRKQAVEAVSLLLGQGDIADLAIDDLRRWGRWELAPEVVSLKNLPTHQAPIVRRALIRYALSCPAEQDQAQILIGEMRAKSPKLVEEVEELLKLESGK